MIHYVDPFEEPPPFSNGYGRNPLANRHLSMFWGLVMVILLTIILTWIVMMIVFPPFAKAEIEGYILGWTLSLPSIGPT